MTESEGAAVAAHDFSGPQIDVNADRFVKRRILILDAVTPTPDRDSGSFITFRMMKAFQELGYQITFVPQHNYAYHSSYTAALQRIGIECLYLPYFSNITDVLDFRSNFDLVLAYRFNVLEPVLEEIRRRVSTAPIIFHNVDLHFLREEREAELYGDESKRLTAAVTREAELGLIAKVDCTIVHTTVETATIKRYLSVDNIVEFPYVAEVHRSEVACEDRHDIMFLGNFLHLPNVDAVMHFVSSVWPLVAKRLPDRSRLIIAGPSAPEEIKALAGVRVVVTGHVEDLQPYFEMARVFVAPLRYGAGIKGKVIQSLCYGTPSVITPIAAEGIGLTSGRETVIASTDAEFADGVMTAFSDRDLWYRLQAAGYEFVENNFSSKQCLDLCTRVIETATATWLARRSAQG